MEIFGDIERLVADLYPCRWLIAFGVLVVLAWVAAFGYYRGWQRALWRRRPTVAIVGTPVLAAVIIAGWFLVSPLVTNVTVEEELPFAFGAVVPTDMTEAEVAAIMAGMAKVNQGVNEAMPAPMVMANAAGNVVKLKTGSFQDADSFHKGSGQATIFRGPDGSRLLRLEDLSVTNGPDLHVILTPHPNPTSRGDVHTSGYIDLGKVKGNRGNQNYPVPDNVDIDSQGSVVIYCAPFHVIFSVASLQGTG